MKKTIKTVLAVAIFLLFASFALAQTAAFDVVITNGHIIDGTGSPWYSGDLGIRDGKIAAIGNLSAAPRKRTIDAAGKVVAPGFIDMLGQSETTILVDPRLPSKIYQGITSEITGEGSSIAPLNDAIIQSDRSGLRPIQNHSRLADVSRIFRTTRQTGNGHQPRQLCRCDPSPPDDSRRRRQAAHSGTTRSDESSGSRGHEGWRSRSLYFAAIRASTLCEDHRN